MMCIKKVGNILLSIVFFIVLIPIATCDAEGFPVGFVIKKIEEEINIARTLKGPGGIKFIIKEVDVLLTSEAISEVSGSISLTVPILSDLISGGSIKRKFVNTQRMSLKMVPKDDPIPVSGGESLGLVQAIKSVKNALVQQALTNNNLKLKAFEFEAEFVVDKANDGTIKFVFLQGGIKGEKIEQQKVKFYMELP